MRPKWHTRWTWHPSDVSIWKHDLKKTPSECNRHKVLSNDLNLFWWDFLFPKWTQWSYYVTVQSFPWEAFYFFTFSQPILSSPANDDAERIDISLSIYSLLLSVHYVGLMWGGNLCFQLLCFLQILKCVCFVWPHAGWSQHPEHCAWKRTCWGYSGVTRAKQVTAGFPYLNQFQPVGLGARTAATSATGKSLWGSWRDDTPALRGLDTM